MTVFGFQRDQEILLRNRRVRLTSISVIKLFLSLGTLGLAIFLEYEHEKVNRLNDFKKRHSYNMIYYCHIIIYRFS